jgi:hypothetical protein
MSCPSSTLDEPRLLDADGIDGRTSDASSLSTRRAAFRQELIDRDTTCVLIGSPADDCDACHIIPRSKGDEVRPEMSPRFATNLTSLKYMANLVCHRGGIGDDDTLDSIDDIRNGLLLTVTLDRRFGIGEIAFLRVSHPMPRFSFLHIIYMINRHRTLL